MSINDCLVIIVTNHCWDFFTKFSYFNRLPFRERERVREREREKKKDRQTDRQADRDRHRQRHRHRQRQAEKEPVAQRQEMVIGTLALLWYF